MSQPFEVTVLGCSSALPTAQRHPTAQLINIAERYFLVDCGEGTQMQLRRYHFRIQRINHILISHLHGDHYFGLVGLLSSMHLLGRTATLHLYHPPGLKEIIELQMRYSGTELAYAIEYREHQETPHLIFEDKMLEVHGFPLNHRIPCTGFLFREKKRPYSIDKEKVEQYKIPFSQMSALKEGRDALLPDGTVIANHLVTKGRNKSRSYAFCSDTCYDPSVVEQVRGVDLLYHEATFAEDMIERARLTFHTTARGAGRVAAEAGVQQLIIGHFSARYMDTEPLLAEARAVFPNTVAAADGLSFKLDEQLLVQKIG